MSTGNEGDPQGPIGPTLGSVPPDRQPNPMPACATCPKAMWYRTSRQLRAFCRELRHISWQDGELEPIVQCDGREAALMPLDGPAT